MLKHYEIHLPAVHDSLRKFYQFFREVSLDLGLDEKTQFDIELSIEEALTNVINHAYKGGVGDFALRIMDEGDQLRVEIQDWGDPFDPNAIKPFDYSAPVETRIDGGMGVHFMRTLMDSIDYTFHDTNGTLLTMTKKRTPSPLSPQFDEEIEHELHVLDSVARAILIERHVDSLLDLIIDKLTEVIHADRGTLYLIDEDTQELYSKILQDETGRLAQIRLKIGEGVAGYIAETGETVNIASVENDPHFAPNFDRQSGYQTQTMLGTPMLNAKGKIIGVIQMLNKRDGGVFTHRDEIILTVLASQAAIAIENAQLLASEQEKRRLADTLREVSAIINSALDLEEVLKLILNQFERVVPFDIASILLIEGESLVVGAVRGLAADSVPLNTPLFKVEENPLIQEMVLQRQPIIIPNVLEDKRWIQISLTENVRAWMGVPLVVGNRLIGQLSLNHAKPGFYRQSHAEVALTFANQAVAAIERARLYKKTIEQARLQQEVETARTIQSSFLPDANPQIDGWDIAASWEPAKEVAGDFFDFIPLPDNRLGFVVADVCGKGIPASLFMALSRTVLRVMAQSDLPPDELLYRVNNQLKSDSTSSLFVTLFYGILDPQTGVIVYGNGGHNPPIYLTQANEPLLIESSGPALGVFANVGYELGQLTLGAEELLVVYTDGLTEAINRDEHEFEEERLLNCVVEHRDLSATALNSKIRDAVKAFAQDRPFDDDATILIIKRNR